MFVKPSMERVSFPQSPQILTENVPLATETAKPCRWRGGGQGGAREIRGREAGEERAGSGNSNALEYFQKHQPKLYLTCI